MEVFPEMEGQPFSEVLQQVLDNKITAALKVQPLIIIQPDGNPVTRHVDMSFDPLVDVNGGVDAVLVTVSDVTEMVRARHLLQNRQEELEAMNEEMAASNEEIRSINEEYEAGNEELTAVNEELRQTAETADALLSALKDSEEYFSQAMDAVDLSTWQQNPDDHSIVMNRRCREVFGFSGDGPLTLENLIEATAAESREDFRNALQLAAEYEPVLYALTVADINSGERRSLHGFHKRRCSANGKSWLMGIIFEHNSSNVLTNL